MDSTAKEKEKESDKASPPSHISLAEVLWDEKEELELEKNQPDPGVDLTIALTSNSTVYDKPVVIRHHDVVKHDSRTGNVFKFSSASIGGARSGFGDGGAYSQRYGFSGTDAKSIRGIGEHIFENYVQGSGPKLVEFLFVAKYQALGYFSCDGVISFSSSIQCGTVREKLDQAFRDSGSTKSIGYGDLWSRITTWGESLKKGNQGKVFEVVAVYNREQVISNMAKYSDQVYVKSTVVGADSALRIIQQAADELDATEQERSRALKRKRQWNTDQSQGRKQWKGNKD